MQHCIIRVHRDMLASAIRRAYRKWTASTRSAEDVEFASREFAYLPLFKIAPILPTRSPDGEWSKSWDGFERPFQHSPTDSAWKSHPHVLQSHADVHYLQAWVLLHRRVQDSVIHELREMGASVTGATNSQTRHVLHMVDREELEAALLSRRHLDSIHVRVVVPVWEITCLSWEMCERGRAMVRPIQNRPENLSLLWRALDGSDVSYFLYLLYKRRCIVKGAYPIPSYVRTSDNSFKLEEIVRRVGTNDNDPIALAMRALSLLPARATAEHVRSVVQLEFVRS